MTALPSRQSPCLETSPPKCRQTDCRAGQLASTLMSDLSTKGSGMNSTNLAPEVRIALLRASGVPINVADEKRVADSVGASVKALAVAVQGSLFDTEPLTFDVTLARLAREPQR